MATISHLPPLLEPAPKGQTGRPEAIKGLCYASSVSQELYRTQPTLFLSRPVTTPPSMATSKNTFLCTVTLTCILLDGGREPGKKYDGNRGGLGRPGYRHRPCLG